MTGVKVESRKAPDRKSTDVRIIKFEGSLHSFVLHHLVLGSKQKVWNPGRSRKESKLRLLTKAATSRFGSSLQGYNVMVLKRVLHALRSSSSLNENFSPGPDCLDNGRSARGLGCPR